MSDAWFKVILAIIPVIGTIITGILVPMIKAKIDNEKLITYEVWVNKAVQCAEQIYTKEEWQKKKQYVVDFISEMFGGKLTPSQIDILIEASVQQLHLAEKE